MLLAVVALVAVLPASLAKFAVPIEKLSESVHGATWDTTYRMANLAGPIAICDNPLISAQLTGVVSQEVANASAVEAQLVTPEFTAKGFWYWTNSSGYDAEAVSNDMTTFVGELASTHSDIITELNNPVYGCSVEPYCDFGEGANPCVQGATGQVYCTLFVCMFTSYTGETGRSRATKSRRDANFLPLLEGASTTPKAKAMSLRDTYPRNATIYYQHLAQPNVRLQLASNKDQEDIARMILDHFQCDPFLDPKANMENIPWDNVPTFKDRNIDLMRRRSQLKPIFERVFVIDEAEMSDEERPIYREDSIVRLLQSVQRYANFVKMRFERVGCAYIPQCSANGNQEFPLAVMVCVTVQSYSGPTPPPIKRTTTVPTVMSQTGASVPVPTGTPAVTETATEAVEVPVPAEPLQTVEPLVVEEVTTVAPAAETVTEPTEPVEPAEPEVADPSLVEDMNNQKLKI